MTFENLLVEMDGSVAIVTINRPKTLNALDVATMRELHECFGSLDKNPDLRAVIITGAGDKSFVSGADIQEILELDFMRGREFTERGNWLYLTIEKFRVPVIAAVNGYALGGGCELAMACHIRIASENARFGQPEINLGIIPGYGGTQRLTRLVGRGRALELMLTGRIFSSQEATTWGLVQSVVPPAELMPTARKLAAELATKAPRATRAILEAVEQGLQVGPEESLHVEENLFASCCATEDKNEGCSAFLSKRKPEFKGR